jgi:predicted DNA-binding transcriptional regulator YafY
MDRNRAASRARGLSRPGSGGKSGHVLPMGNPSHFPDEADRAPGDSLPGGWVKPMSRGDQLIRQWRILRLVESSRLGRTAAELHEQVEDMAGLRTVYRDLEALQGAGFPLYQDDDGRWRMLAPSEGGLSLPIHPSELIGLLLSEQVMAPLEGTELAEPLSNLRSKLEAMLEPSARQYVDELRGGLLATTTAPGDYAGRRSDLQVVEMGIRERRCLLLTHFAAHRGEELERTVDPYGLWYVDGGLYLIAFDHLRSDFRKYLVDRIRSVSALNEEFVPDPDFNLQTYVGRGFRVWHGAVHRVVVEFTPAVAHLPRERRYHRTQKTHDQPDGGCRVTLDAAGLPELASWVASFGGAVRAREPAELVEMVRDLHRRGLENHEPPGGPDDT